MNHDLKTHPKHFHAASCLRKTFEIRKNDRNFAVGDTLTLREYLPERGHFTGDLLMVGVTHILTHAELPEAIQPGFCILSIQRLGAELRRAPVGALHPGHGLTIGQARVLEVSPVAVNIETFAGERMLMPPDGIDYRPEQVVAFGWSAEIAAYRIAPLEEDAQ